MDIRMPVWTASPPPPHPRPGARERSTHPVLTTFDLDEYVYKALRAGASGFVLKDTPPERLLAALKAVADGDTLFSPTVTRRLIEAFCAAEDGIAVGAAPMSAAVPAGVNGRAVTDRAAAERSSAGRAALAVLTVRETDVLRLVATGLSNGEIAQRLVVSEGTVKTHLNRSMAKLNLSSRAQVVVLAYESGLVVPGRTQPPAQPPVTVSVSK